MNPLSTIAEVAGETQALLDQINDIEATIARIEAEAPRQISLAYRHTLQSLESRRGMFEEELAAMPRPE